MSSNCSGITCRLEVITPLAKKINCLDVKQIAEICITEIPPLIRARLVSLYILDETSDILHLEKNNHPFLINNIVSLNQNPPSEVQLAGLVARLEDERSRATTLIGRHRDLQERARKALEQLGEAQRITALNEGRESLRDFVTRTEATLDTEAVERLELEARAQAATLDVLETLDRGLPPPTARPATDEGNVRERAERLLRDGPYDRILQDG